MRRGSSAAFSAEQPSLQNKLPCPPEHGRDALKSLLCSELAEIAERAGLGSFPGDRNAFVARAGFVLGSTRQHRWLRHEKGPLDPHEKLSLQFVTPWAGIATL